MGHGGYLGPDWTADYLRRSAMLVLEDLRSAGVQDPQEALVLEFRTNRYDEDTGVLVWTDRQVMAFEEVRRHYGDYFGSVTTQYGLIPEAITDPREIHQLTTFFAWTTWAAAAERPDLPYSYTTTGRPSPW